MPHFGSCPHSQIALALMLALAIDPPLGEKALGRGRTQYAIRNTQYATRNRPVSRYHANGHAESVESGYSVTGAHR